MRARCAGEPPRGSDVSWISARDAGAGPSAARGGFPRLWREAHSPPRPLLAGYLDAAAQSWDLTFLRLRRPRDPRQGALRASSGRGREDAKSCDSVPGEWVMVPVSTQQDQAELAVIS